MPEETKNPTEQKDNSSTEQQRTQDLNQARFKNIKEKMAQKAASFASAGATQKPIPLSHFIILLTLALINDVGDWFGLDIASFRLVDVLIGGILFLYCYLKGYNKNTIKMDRWFTVILSELVPVWGDIMTSWIIFIIYVYLKSKKDYEQAQELAKSREANEFETEEYENYEDADYELEQST